MELLSLHSCRSTVLGFLLPVLLLLSSVHAFTVPPPPPPPRQRRHPQCLVATRWQVSKNHHTDMGEDTTTQLLSDDDDASSWLVDYEENDQAEFGLSTDVRDDVAASVNGEAINKEEDEIVRFVQMMKDTPAGLLEQDVALLLRETMDELIGVAAEGHDENVVETLQLATDLLQRLVQEYQGVQRIDAPRAAVIAPRTADFDRLYEAWLASSSGDRVATHILPTSTAKVQALLALQQEPYLQQVAQPTNYSYELVLKLLSQSRYCAKPAWQIFKHVPQRTMAMYNAVIASTAKSRHTHSASRAETLLRQAAETGQFVAVETCNRVVTNWAKSGVPYGPERAESLIRWMDTQENVASPNAQTFTSLMDAYAQQTSWDGAVRCQRILENLVNLYMQEQDASLEPTVVTWTIALQAWSRLAKKNSSKASTRAALVFVQWQQLHREGKVAQAPDALAYQTVMQAFMRTDAAKAEEWLDKQYQAYKESGNETLKPTVRSVRSVVEAWVRRRDDPNAMEEAEFVWERYQEIIDSEPGNKELLADLYKTILLGYCQRQEAGRALELIQEMVERDLHPDCICYDRVLEANTQQMADGSDEASIKRAYAIFALMEEERKAGQVKPNERVYTSFIRALTKANIPKLAYKARILLQRMRELSISDSNPALVPTVYTYNAVLMAAATEGVPSAFTVAVQTFNELRKDKTATLDHVSIGNMIRCASLLEEDDPKRSGLIRSTFGLGCKMGLINVISIRDLRLIAPTSLVHELLGAEYAEDEDDDKILEALPSEWTYNSAPKQRNQF